jgi:hypothetical protein
LPFSIKLSRTDRVIPTYSIAFALGLDAKSEITRDTPSWTCWVTTEGVSCALIALLSTTAHELKASADTARRGKAILESFMFLF